MKRAPDDSSPRARIRLFYNDLRSVTRERSVDYERAQLWFTIHRGKPHEPDRPRAYCTALIMSKIGRYMATTMPPTTTPRNTIITGSINESSAETAASTSSS